MMTEEIEDSSVQKVSTFDENTGNKSFQVAKDSDTTVQSNGAPIGNVLKEKSVTGNSHMASSNNSTSGFDPDAVAQFFNLPTTEVSSIDPSLLKQLAAKVSEFENLVGEKDLLAAQLNQTTHNCKRQIASVKQMNEELQKSNSQYKAEIQSSFEKQQELNKQIGELSLEVNELKKDNNGLRLSIENSQKMNQTNVDYVAKINKENSELSSNLQQLQLSKQSLDAEILKLKAEINSLKNDVIKASFTKEELQNRLELSQKSLDWYKSEMEDKTHEANSLKSDNFKKLNELQLKLDTALNDKQNLLAQIESVKQAKHEYQKKYQDLSVEFEQLKTSKYLDSENFFNEISSKDKLIESLKEANKNLQLHIEELNNENDESKQKLIEHNSRLQDDLMNKSNKVEQLEERIEQLDDVNTQMLQITDGKSSSSHVNDALVSFTKNNALLSKTNVPKLYSEYLVLKKQLLYEKRLKEQMQEQLDRFAVELEQKVPLITVATNKNKFLEQELDELSGILERETMEKKQLIKDFDKMKQERQDFGFEIGSLIKIKHDLSKQIQYLLLQVYLTSNNKEEPLSDYEKDEIEKIMENHHVAPFDLQKIEDEILRFSSTSSTDLLISNRLVLFKNISELQGKNTELLKVVRTLGNKLETQEQESQRSLESLETNTIVEAKEAIKTLQEDIKSLEIRLGSAEREREFYKNMIANGERFDQHLLTNGISDTANDNSAELEKELDAFKEQTKKIVDDLNIKIELLKNEKATLMMEVSKYKSTGKILEQQYKTLKDSFDFSSEEIKNLKSQNAKLGESLSQKDAKLSDLMNKVFESRSKTETLKFENNNLQNEKHLLQTSRDRIVEENKVLKEEKQGLNQVIANYQQMSLMRETDSKALAEQMMSQIEDFKQEASANKAELQKLRDLLKETEEKNVNEASTYNERISSLGAQLAKVKQDLSEKVFEVEQKNTQLRLLESQLNGSKQIVESMTSSGPDFTELSKLQEELALNAEEMNKFKEIAIKSEESLMNMNKVYDELKKTSEKEVTELKTKVSKLESDNSELSKLKASFENKVNELEVRIAKNKEFEEKMSSFKQELDTHVKLEQELRQSYETELTNHAKTIESSRVLQIKNEEIESKYTEVHNKYNQILTQFEESKASWEAQKLELENQLQECNSRMDDFAVQNKLLHSQLENATKVGSVSEEISNESKIISFLRKEKDVIAAELNAKIGECSRLSIELNNARDEVEKLKFTANRVQEPVENFKDRYEQTVDQMNLYRESNVTLRDEIKQKTNLVASLESQISELQQQIAPLQAKLVENESVLSLKDEEIKMLQEETQSWKQKLDKLFSTYGKVDVKDLEAKEEALKKAEKDRTDLQNTVHRLKQEFQNKLSSRSKESKELKEEIEKLKKEAHILEEENKTLKTKMNTLTGGNKGSFKAKIIELNKEKTAVEVKVKALEQQLEALKKQNAEETEKYEESKRAADKEITRLNELLKQAEAAASTAAASAADSGSSSGAASAVELSALNNQIEELKTQFSQEKKQLEDSKNAEIEKLKQEYEAKVASATSGDGESSVNIEELKRKWQQEEEPKVEERINSALEELRSKLTAPSRQRIEQLASSKFEEYKQKHGVELKTQAEKNGKKEFEKKVATLNKQHAKKVEELTQEYEEKVNKAKEAHQMELKQQFESGRKAGSLKLKMLESRISKLNEELNKVRSAETVVPVARPAINLPAKRSAEEDVAQEDEKKVKTD